STKISPWTGPSILALVVMTLSSYVAYYAMYAAPNKDAFITSLVTLLQYIPLAVSWQTWVSVSGNSLRCTSMQLAKTFHLLVFLVPMIEEALFRLILPRYLSWIGTPDVVTIVCSVVFGLWHF